VRLAARGQRDLDDGPQSIEDAAEREQLQRQARGVAARSILTALALTALAIALPWP
jgi:hypothetical protein